MLFFNKDKEKEQLKKELKYMEETLKFNEIELQVLSVLQTMIILSDFKKLDEQDIMDYAFSHMKAIIDFVAKNRFNLKGFILNPDKREEFVTEMAMMISQLLGIARQEINSYETGKYLIPMIKKIENYASPNPRYNYNISEFN